jgi:hypothetical protein
MAALDAWSGGYRTVIDSAEHLLGVLPKGEARIEAAVDDLCRAVDALSAEAHSLGRQNFESTAEPTLTLDAALNEAASQARVAQVLFAASAAVGEETSANRDVQTAGKQGRVLSATVSEARSDLSETPLSVFRFEAAPGVEVSLADAVAALRIESRAALDRVVVECDRTASGMLSAIADRKDAVLGSLGSIAKQLEQSMPSVKAVFQLVSRAWNWLLKSIKSLQAIADQLPLDELKAKLEPIVAFARPRTAIERLLDVDGARAEIDAWRLGAPLGVDAIAGARTELAALTARFVAAAENARLIQGILAGIAGLVAMKLTGPMAPLVIPSVHMLIVASVVVLAIDCADAHASVNFVKGIRQVGRDLSQQTDASHGQRA